jgi:hypothetical protein
MVRSGRTREPRETPWWLTVDSVCPSCHQHYAYQTHSYCVVCDQAICSICFQVTASVELTCAGCSTIEVSWEGA